MNALIGLATLVLVYALCVKFDILPNLFKRNNDGDGTNP